MLEKNVRINAQEVVVNEKPKRRNRNRGRAVRIIQERQQKGDYTQLNEPRVNRDPSKPPNTGSRRSRSRTRRRRPGPPTNISEASNPMPENVEAFIVNYAAPGLCERTAYTGQVPDGTLDVSVSLDFRYTETISFPFVNHVANPDITNPPTYSLLMLQFPLFRSLAIGIVNTADGELTSDELGAFMDSFNTIPKRELATYPLWVPVTDTVYWTSFDTEAMRNVEPPDENGNSGTINSFRFTSQKMELVYNVPDLLNQGTYTLHRWPLNQSTRVEIPQSAVPRGIIEYLYSNFTVISSNETRIDLNSYPLTGNPHFPVFNGNVLQLPTPIYTATTAFRNAANTFSVDVGDSLQYQLSSLGARTIRLVNLSNTQFIVVLTLPANPVPSTSGFDVVRFYRTSSDDDDEFPSINLTVRMLSIPPFTQSDSFQQDPKTKIALSKTTDGAATTGAIYQPVFLLTQSNTYSKTVMSAYDVKSGINDYGFGGWHDTTDSSFGVEVLNFQNIVYSAKPLLVLERVVETVPAPNSILGAVITGIPPSYPGIETICKAISHESDMGVGANQMATVASQICRELERYEDGERTEARILDVVKGVLGTFGALKGLRGKTRRTGGVNSFKPRGLLRM